MQINHVLIFTENGKFQPASVRVEDDKILEIIPEKITDGEEERLFMIPGLIDLHFHGCMGADLSDGLVEGIETISKYEASIGVTSICPASMSIPAEELHQVMKSVREYNKKEREGARFVGVNLEGPFVNKAKKGAQAEEAIIPCDLELYRSLQEESGHMIRLVDLAPETEGAMEFIDAVKDEVVVSIAHTMADYDTAKTAIERGCTHVTHLYNAMPAFTHRAPGVVGAACDAPQVHVEMIHDGVHIHPSVMRATYQMLGASRIIMISDSMRATGFADGISSLGGQEVHVKGRYATLADGTLAGSVTNLMDCLRYTVLEAGIPLEHAVTAASMNPAKELHIFDEVGSITVGKKADYCILDHDLNLQEVVIGGVHVSK